MGFINIYVGSDAYVNIENRQLKLSNSIKQATYPLEDINSVLLDNVSGSISFTCLNKLAEFGIITFICNEKHLPSAYILPFNSHFKIYSVYKLQESAKKPLLKNIWRKIVVQKISNQMAVLDMLNINHDLIGYISKVQSGDSTNVEAVVAGRYFKLLFGYDFTRTDENSAINSALNFGYAILRGAISRSLAVHGLQPFLGIHHINELNNFNLADDLIEPFRPVVDLYISKNRKNYEKPLDRASKMSLLNILNVDIKINNQIQSLGYAIDIVVSSFISCLKTENSNIALPEILDINIHKYE